ncbi:hypothetical protein C1646_756762 [Rhizophagus diaphanus]|nr:hypothetical protein C1646_756762 [Rhizophagus diaphanus] [Rhizophagus sp. MUCL 43196]
MSKGNKRVRSLQRLEDKLIELNYQSIKLEVLSSTQKAEENVTRVVRIIPDAGTAYQLISSGVAVVKASVSAALFKGVFRRTT